jgi:predicted glycosyltransferase
VRVWIDMTASAHVLVFRPLIRILRARGDEVEITARDYAQTLQLLELHGLECEVVGRHGGRARLGKARQLVSRLGALRRWARGREFDVALAHGSHELTLTARRLRIPSSTTFDYEYAWLQHQLGCRAATKVVVPQAMPPDRLQPYGVDERKLVQYPGLKEEYYLSDFEPDAAVLDPWEIDAARVLVVLRPPPDVSLYHRHSNPLFPQTLDYLGRHEGVHAIVLPRTEEQRDFVRRLALPSVIVPERAVDAQSLIALSDLVVSAGGTMNREAVALGVPVYTTFGGRLGGVDEMLIRDRRLLPLSDPRALDLRKRAEGDGGDRVRRDPAEFLELLLSALR